jgi:formylglycine-generating enzyme required for sulfatase activity
MRMDTERAHAAQPKTRVFVSYSRKDMAFADQLEAALKGRGFEVLIDREQIYAFEDWWKRIKVLIGSADTVVFVLSPDAVKSDVALKEVNYAASLNKRLAPIVCRGVEDSAVPEALRSLHFIVFDDPENFDVRANDLAEALRTDTGWVRQHTEYGEAQRRWAAAGQARGLLLHSPTLEIAEYWIGSRPSGAPEPTAEIKGFIVASRKGARSAQRARRLALASTLTLMAVTILVLIGWINQDYLIAQWRWWTVTRPFMVSQVQPYVLSAGQERALKPGDSFKECATIHTGVADDSRSCPEMIVIPAGSFEMGDSMVPAMEPIHTVTLSSSFAVSRYELTFADWDNCVDGGGCNGYKPNDQSWGRDQHPVINVNWYDAHQYVAWLSLVTGKTYRLLSESEYEYATRAGATTQFPWGDDPQLYGKEMANCNGCGSIWDYQQSAPVGSFPPNKFGLYDMIGNVFEWTEDCWHNNYNGAPADGSAWMKDGGGDCDNHVVRGGS